MGGKIVGIPNLAKRFLRNPALLDHQLAVFLTELSDLNDILAILILAAHRIVFEHHKGAGRIDVVANGIVEDILQPGGDLGTLGVPLGELGTEGTFYGCGDIHCTPTLAPTNGASMDSGSAVVTCYERLSYGCEHVLRTFSETSTQLEASQGSGATKFE